jgi:endonuclease VIII
VPEGDTIYRAARTLGQVLEGKVVTRFETTFAPLASVDDNAPVTGRTVEKVESRGKWLLIRFSGDLILVTHMLMSGSWHIYRAGKDGRAGERWRRPRREMRVVIATAEFEAVAFNVPVTKFYTARTLERNSTIPKLGPDLLSTAFAPDEARTRLMAHGDEEIANVLLNQRVMAGLGNVYKSEVLFACGVHPFRLVSTLRSGEIGCILERARVFLEANVKDGRDGGMVTYAGLRRTTRAADPGARLWVYRREGKECRRCGATILMQRQGPGARSTYWCPTCQPASVA